jgi:hypothetical protein
MKFAIALTMKRVVIGCLCAGTLAAVACADGRGLPTNPSASATGSSAAAPGDDSSGQATAPSSNSSPIHRLLLTKTCDVNFPNVPICTVVTSQEGPLPPNTTALYDLKVIDFGCHEQPAQPGCQRLSANVVLTTPDDDTAAGHCTLSFKTGAGTCTFAQGTGELAGFHANVNVTFDFATGVTTWDGTYHHTGRE